MVISIGTPGGLRKRLNRNANSRADAVAILTKLRGDGLQAPAIRSTSTVAQFLNSWLSEHVKAHKAPATEALYRSMAERIIVPRLGTIGLQKLTAAHVQSFADAMVNDKVKPRTRQVAFAVLRAAIRHALRIGSIDRDPTLGIAKPQHDAKDVFPFNHGECKLLLFAAAGTRWHALIMLAVTTGMRQGELFGLEWGSVDLKAGILRVAQAAAEVGGKVTIRKPKTKSSVRVVELPDAAVVALKDHRKILDAEGNAGGKLVFPAPEGGLMPRTTFRHRYWLPICRRAKLLPRGFHHTRHTYATLALGAGVPPHVVSKVLGHTKPSTTMDIYAHVLQAHQSAATAALQGLFG
ncbi:MAG: tyrosine-type recombinase/integrase [Planctomycetaceae bacterium]|nr:tyrosine-type recombinase/integrase [Planctomycetaceae bacterium]